MSNPIQILRKWWRQRERKYTITVYLNSAKKHLGTVAGEASYPSTDHYRVDVYPGEGGGSTRAVLAHEIGHCVEHLLGNDWHGAAYAQWNNKQVANVDVLKDEAAAWRFAVRMFPDLRSRFGRRWGGFEVYVRNFRKRAP